MRGMHLFTVLRTMNKHHFIVKMMMTVFSNTFVNNRFSILLSFFVIVISHEGCKKKKRGWENYCIVVLSTECVSCDWRSANSISYYDFIHDHMCVCVWDIIVTETFCICGISLNWFTCWGKLLMDWDHCDL